MELFESERIYFEIQPCTSEFFTDLSMPSVNLPFLPSHFALYDAVILYKTALIRDKKNFNEDGKTCEDILLIGL